jgi:2-methylcitrate dehydratase PrpD
MLAPAESDELSRVLATHVKRLTYQDLPAHVVEVTKTSLLDAIGVTLAASGLGEASAPFVAMAKEFGGAPQSTLIGHRIKVPGPMAAFANGAMAHELDFEDTHDGAMVHPNAATVPAALAAAEVAGGVSGKELITAIAIGSDLACRLSLAFRRDPEQFGWYFRPVLGAFGAAAAAGRLLGLSEDQLIQSFALTLCQVTCSGELKRSPESHLRAIRDGFTAKAGYLSALMAGKGVNAFDHPLEGQSGLYRLYSQDGYDPDVLLGALGQRFEGANVSFKPWPSCRGTHSFVEAALFMRERHRLQPASIASVTAIGSGFFEVLATPIEQKRKPATAINAKFSVPFTVATALLTGSIRLEDFAPAALRRPEVLALAQKIDYEVDPNLGPLQSGRGALRIETTDKRILTHKVDEPLGAPLNPLPPEQLTAKFRDCARHAAVGMSEVDINAVAEGVLALENVDDIDALMRRL